MLAKHYFFDLDNTLTRSKMHIAPEHKPILKRLIEKAHVIVVSGHPQKDIRDHLEDVGGYFILGQSGNFGQTPDGRVLWEHSLTPIQVEAAHKFIEKARAHLALSVKDASDLVEDRGCQVSYSLIGHHEKIEVKEAFDPDHKKREKLLVDLKDDVEHLAKDANLEIKIGGTTVLDIFEKGKNKGYNIANFIKLMQWNTDDCLYIGDALFPGGNDETVIGIIPTHPVKDYNETYKYLKSIV